MPLKKLKMKHLARLSPVMHAYNDPFIRKEEWVPIEDGMGVVGENYGNNGVLGDNYETVQKGSAIDPRGEALWSNLYRIGATGSLSRVTPFGPSAFSGFGTNGDNQAQRSFGERLSAVMPLLLAMGATVGVLWVINR